MWSVLDWCLTLSVYPILMVAMGSMSHINACHFQYVPLWYLLFLTSPISVSDVFGIPHIDVEYINNVRH